MKEITSVNNETIKDRAKLQQKKYRLQSGLFLIEGLKCVEEALNSGIKIKDIFISNHKLAHNNKFPQDKIYLVTEAVMKKMTSTQTPPEIMAVGYQAQHKLEDMISCKNPLLIILEDIKDAGNLGTIIRSATAFGANGIIIVGDAVDLYNPKVVRSAVGNLWKLPIIYTAKEEINKIKDQINSTQNCKFYATTVSLEQPKSVQNCDFAHPSVIIFGSEADGISKELLEIADEAITIPMKDSVESLNLSISAGVILYESFRQRLHD